MKPRYQPYQRNNAGGRTHRCTASACVVYVGEGDEEADLQILLMWKQHSPAFRAFFDDLAAMKGSSAAQRLPLMQKDELEKVQGICSNPDEELDGLFREVFSRNPSFPGTLRRWQAGSPLAVFKSLGAEKMCHDLLATRPDADFPLYWEFPGGDVGTNGAIAEDPSVAAVRETYEETGYIVEPAPHHGLNEVNRWGPNKSNVNNVVVCHLPAGRRPTDGPSGIADDVEVRAVRWVPLAAAFHMMRDPRNQDYPNFLRKVACHFLHRTFTHLLALSPMPSTVPPKLDKLRMMMETNLLNNDQKKTLQTMVVEYNALKARGASGPEREAKKQAMLQYVLAEVKQNSQRRSADTYGQPT